MRTAEKVLRRSSAIEHRVLNVLSKVNRINITKLVAALNERLRHHGVCFRQKRMAALLGTVMVDGYCEYDSVTHRTSIVINLCYSDSSVDLVFANNFLALEIVAAMLHELTHREQQKKRGSIGFRDYGTEAEYLALPDEIDAYACEFAYLMHRAKRFAQEKPPSADIHRMLEYRDLPDKAWFRLQRRLFKNMAYLESKIK